MPGTTLIIGLGLLGGSVGLGLREAGVTGLKGHDADPRHLGQALELGLVEGPWDPAAQRAPLGTVILAVPPGAVGEVAAALKPWIGPGTLLMDVCSVKGSVIQAVGEALGPCPGFLPAHPMAGSHLDGPGAARADLFRGRTTILTPLAGTPPEVLAAGRAFWRSLGSETVDLEAGEHDRTLALLSHLPHLLAYTLAGETCRAGADPKLAGPAFRDMTRLPLCPPHLWADILLANREAVRQRLGEFREELGRLDKLLETENRTALQQRLAQARNS